MGFYSPKAPSFKNKQSFGVVSGSLFGVFCLLICFVLFLNGSISTTEQILSVLGKLVFRRISWSSHALHQGIQKQQLKDTRYRLNSQVLKKVFLSPKCALKLGISWSQYSRLCPLYLGYYLSHGDILFHYFSCKYLEQQEKIYLFIYLFIY